MLERLLIPNPIARASSAELLSLSFFSEGYPSPSPSPVPEEEDLPDIDEFEVSVEEFFEGDAEEYFEGGGQEVVVNENQ